MLLFTQLNHLDNVVVALQDLSAGQELVVNGKKILLKKEIKRGHKISIKKILPNEDIIKYGAPIGHATEVIDIGTHVHTHNIKTNLDGLLNYEYKPKFVESQYTMENRTFQGFKRKNGQVGVRNELWVVPTVGCINGVAEMIIKKFKQEVESIHPFDNIMVLSHNFGCSQLGDDHENTREILSDMVHHPNAGGVLVIGLGCENNNLYDFQEGLGEYDSQRVKFLVSQEVTDEIEEGVKLLKEIYANAKDDKRETVPLSELKIGLKCGGSDGLSGITANPLLGKFSDYLIAQGGTTVLTEVPEMFGAEKILMERAENKEIFSKIVHLINDFKEYFIANNQPIYENPSPGNKEGGITTLEDKSLGCTQKAGTSVVSDVLKYGERLKTKGLNLLSAPGNDLVSSSALAAAGCQIVLFTTGRGNPYGTVVPTVKVSSNTALYQKKQHWIDFNAGRLLEENTEEVLRDFIDYIISVANGDLVNNEKNGYRGISIFKTGVTL